jgi:hypothetical protein
LAGDECPLLDGQAQLLKKLPMLGFLGLSGWHAGSVSDNVVKSYSHNIPLKMYLSQTEFGEFDITIEASFETS